MVNVVRLREAMKAQQITPDAVADALGIDKATFYRRLNRQGAKFTVEEVDKFSKLLNLSSETMQDIFFDK